MLRGRERGKEVEGFSSWLILDGKGSIAYVRFLIGSLEFVVWIFVVSSKLNFCE